MTFGELYIACDFWKSRTKIKVNISKKQIGEMKAYEAFTLYQDFQVLSFDKKEVNIY